MAILRIRVIVYRYGNEMTAEADIARQLPDGVRQWSWGSMSIVTLLRGNRWNALRQIWRALR